MAEDGDPLAPAGGSGLAPKRINCEFCDCQLASSGEVLKRSTRAKELIALEETVDDLRAEVAAAKAAVLAAEQATATATAALADVQRKAEGSAIRL